MKNLLVLFVFALGICLLGNQSAISQNTMTKEKKVKKEMKHQSEHASAMCNGVNEEETAAVVGNHLKMFGENNLEGIIKDYTEESVIITPDVTYRGLDEIMGMFEAVVPMFPADNMEFNLIKQEFFGDLAYIYWTCETPYVSVPLGTDTFIIRDGKIFRQTFTATVVPKEEGK